MSRASSAGTSPIRVPVEVQEGSDADADDSFNSAHVVSDDEHPSPEECSDNDESHLDSDSEGDTGCFRDQDASSGTEGDSGDDLPGDRTSVPSFDESQLLAKCIADFGTKTLPGSATTIAVAVVLIMSFIAAHGLPWSAVDDLLKLVEALFGFQGCGLPQSKYLLRKLWSAKCDSVSTYHYCCSQCGKLLDICSDEVHLTCNVCRSTVKISDVKSGGTFFSILDVGMQLSSTIERLSGVLFENLSKLKQQAEGHLLYLHSKPDVERTSAGIRRDMTLASRLKTPVNGLKGVSPLVKLPHFDLVLGYTVEYMHSVLLGVTRQFADYWFDSLNSNEPYYMGRPSTLRLINRRLLSIRPPHQFTRLPRTLLERRYWKAHEWRNWLLFYCLPCCRPVLPQRYFRHFSILSEAIFVLLLPELSSDQIDHAEVVVRKRDGKACTDEENAWLPPYVRHLEGKRCSDVSFASAHAKKVCMDPGQSGHVYRRQRKVFEKTTDEEWSSFLAACHRSGSRPVLLSVHNSYAADFVPVAMKFPQAILTNLSKDEAPRTDAALREHCAEVMRTLSIEPQV
ncbi:hypothetical protein MTO96_016458 [Rhipicephalus appendiculatus]